MDVRLSYIHGYSNWGPTNVYGTAKVWIDEGVAMMSVHNLPYLPNGENYGWWLVNTKTGDSLPLGAFNTTQAGDATANDVFNQAPPQGVNALVVTVMHPGDPAGAPGPLRALAGFFTAQSVPQAQPAVTPTQVAPQPTATPVPPATPAPRHQTQRPATRHHGSRTVVPHGNAHPLPAHSGTRHARHSAHAKHRIVVLPTTGGGPAARPCPRVLPPHHAPYPCTRH